METDQKSAVRRKRYAAPLGGEDHAAPEHHSSSEAEVVVSDAKRVFAVACRRVALVWLGAVIVADARPRQPRTGGYNRPERGSHRSRRSSHRGKAQTKNWCCPEPCRPMSNRRFMRAPMATCFAGTKTSARM